MIKHTVCVDVLPTFVFFSSFINKSTHIPLPPSPKTQVITDGTAHAVDSSDMAFRIAAAAAVREGMRAAQPAVLEPIMNLEVCMFLVKGVCGALRVW